MTEHDPIPTAGIVTPELSNVAPETLARLAQHLAYETATFVGLCDLIGPTGGPCMSTPVGVAWENGYADLVCEPHAEAASARGALIVRAARHDGTASIVAPDAETAQALDETQRFVIECPARCADHGCTDHEAGTWRVSKYLPVGLTPEQAQVHLEAHASEGPDSGPYRLRTRRV